MCEELAKSLISLTLELDNESDKISVIKALKEKLLVVERQFYQKKWDQLDSYDKDFFASSESYVQSFLEFTSNNESLGKRLQYVFLGDGDVKPSNEVLGKYRQFLKHLGLCGKKRPRQFQPGAPRSFRRLDRDITLCEGGGLGDRIVSPSKYSGSFPWSASPSKRAKVGGVVTRHKIFNLLKVTDSSQDVGCKISSLPS